jgi:hypothetical protein
LVPGENQWELKGYTRTDVEAVTGVGTGSDAPTAVDPKSIGELSLTWWVRQPASFLLRIPFAPDLRALESKRRSAVLDLLVRSVQKARAAGVNCAVDVPEPSHTEQELAADHWIVSKVRVGVAEDATADEGNSATRLVTTMREPHVLEEHNPSFLALFDVTRLDWNHLGEP